MNKNELELYLQKIEKDITAGLFKTGLNGFNINLLTRNICRSMPNVQTLHIDREKVYIRTQSPEYIVLSFVKPLPGREVACSSFYRHITYEEAVNFIFEWKDWIENCLNEYVESGMTQREKQVADILKNIV